MFALSCSRTAIAVPPLLCLSFVLGCRVEQSPSRIERQQQHLAQLASSPLPVLPQPEIDNAEQVIRACGAPGSDTVIPIYSKDYNGPVRRLRYGGKRPVELSFIPSSPRADLAYQEAPLPHPAPVTAQLPPNATWRFEDARLDKEVMITSHRLGFYLPCAGDALRSQF